MRFVATCRLCSRRASFAASRLDELFVMIVEAKCPRGHAIVRFPVAEDERLLDGRKAIEPFLEAARVVFNIEAFSEAELGPGAAEIEESGAKELA